MEIARYGVVTTGREVVPDREGSLFDACEGGVIGWTSVAHIRARPV